MNSSWPFRLSVAATVACSLVSCGSKGPVRAATTVPAATTVAPVAGAVVNTWKPSTIDPTKLPIGDSRVSISGPSVGGLWACRAGNANAGGASAEGPWLDVANDTWDSTTKLAVQGSVSWPQSSYRETVADGKRIVETNDLPAETKTGTFPIAKADPSYNYDRNPGSIAAQR